MADTRAARKETMPYSAAVAQEWASNLVESQHEEVLYSLGELCIFTLMWRPRDFDNGLVEHCSRCFGTGTGTDLQSRAAAAYDQPTDTNCPVCYGTTFEGGFRAQIIRPTLVNDRDQDTVDGPRGEVVRDTAQFETSSDFLFHRGDYLFRADGTRYQTEERNEVNIRPGFASPNTSDSMSGPSTAYLEEHTAVAYLIPPTVEQQRILLSVSGPFTVDDMAASDLIKPGGYLFESE